MNASNNNSRAGLCAAATVMMISLGCGIAGAGTIDKLRQDKSLRIGVRDDAPPFSYKDSKGDPTGYMVDLCRAVAQALAAQLNVGELKVSYVPVTAANRFDAIEAGKADLLCEPTTATLSRREHVDFSIPTFVDGTGLLVTGTGPNDFNALAGKKIGVLSGTTTEEELRNTLTRSGVSAEVVPAKTHEEGLAMLDKEQIAAYFADKAILAYLVKKSSAPDKLHLASNYLSMEPYALALPRGDSDFRLAVDRALSRIYRSGQIATIFAATFGQGSAPSEALKIVYLTAALPD
jgi:ABC-type amino acid transport substrate-binding protein